MNKLYITGTSKGIGNAIALKFLSIENWEVNGIGRTQTISQQNYRHSFLDLSYPEKTKEIQFAHNHNNKSIVLINNSGIIGEISPCGNQSNTSIIESQNINLISTILLTNQFLKDTSNFEGRKMIINISSGAGRHPIDCWSSYCAAKAGVDMFSQVVQIEQNRMFSSNPAKIYSVAPGVVDTSMQELLRNTNSINFPDKDRFVKLFEKKKLSMPKEVAENIFTLVTSNSVIDDVIIDLRKLF